MKKKNGLLQAFFYNFFENSSDELCTGNTRHFRKSMSIIYWFLLRYTMIIYKFTQGNLGAQKIPKSRFQSPVKKKKSQIVTLATDSAIPGVSKIFQTQFDRFAFDLWKFFMLKNCMKFTDMFCMPLFNESVVFIIQLTCILTTNIKTNRHYSN